MLLVQKFLENKTFGDLSREHGVYASFSKSGHKFSLNYDQIEAKESDPLAQECRGLILSLEDGRPIFGTMAADGKLNRDSIEPGKTKILAFPMKRFFNHGQGSAAAIDWSDPNLSVLEKLDGTLCIVYWDSFTSQWCVATRAVPEADLVMDNGLFTFRTLFEKAVLDTMKMTFDQLTNMLVKEITYCFELTTPYNRIVVHYHDCKITLLAARYLNTLEEINPNELAIVQLGQVPCVQAHTYTSVSELVDWVSSLNPMEHEGIVARDSHFNRIKVKNAAYVAYNRARDVLGTSERNCLELILQEKDDDVIPFLPEEIVNNLIKIKKGITSAIQIYDGIYDVVNSTAKIQCPKDKKTFALQLNAAAANYKAQKNTNLWTAPFYQIFDGKARHMKDFIKKNRKDGTWSNSFLDKLLEIAKHSIL